MASKQAVALRTVTLALGFSAANRSPLRAAHRQRPANPVLIHATTERITGHYGLDSPHANALLSGTPRHGA